MPSNQPPSSCVQTRVVFNQKGGVGKTTISCNLAASIANLGKKVLVIDLDSQANTSQYLLGSQYNQIQMTISDFFESTLKMKIFQQSLAPVLVKTDYENLWVIPADNSLSDLQSKLESRYKVYKLRNALEEIISMRQFEYVFIDTPPALNFYSMSALLASDSVIIPFDCDAFSAHAMSQVCALVEEVRQDHQTSLYVEGIIINQYQQNSNLSKEVIQNLVLNPDIPVLEPYISTSVVVKESHQQQKPLSSFRKSHKLTKEFDTLAHLLLSPLHGKINDTARNLNLPLR